MDNLILSLLGTGGQDNSSVPKTCTAWHIGNNLYLYYCILLYVPLQKGITSHPTIIVVYKHHLKKPKKPKVNRTTKIQPKPNQSPNQKQNMKELKKHSFHYGKIYRAF